MIVFCRQNCLAKNFDIDRWEINVAKRYVPIEDPLGVKVVKFLREEYRGV